MTAPAPAPSLLARIVGLSWPVLVGQLAAMGMQVADTLLVARYDTRDLAAVAVGSGIYISVVLAGVGILQALSPTIAHLHGARDDKAIAPAFHQGVWLALFLTLPATALLLFPDPLLALSRLDPPVEEKTRAYLGMLAFAMPAVMLYRAFYAFNHALGRPQPAMVISLLGTCLHVPLAWALIHGRFGLPALGAVGCGLSAALVSWFGFCAGVALLVSHPMYRPYRVFQGWHGPRMKPIGELLRLGLPIGFSSFVEVTSFTLIALFVARLGPEVVAGHRVVSNLYALLFMLPLALASGTLVLVGHAAGARDWPRARATAATGIALATALGALFGLAAWLAAGPVIRAYTPDGAVRGVAFGLIGYAAWFLMFDAVHTVASFSLRGYKVTFAPMLVHVGSFWGVGLAGGYWLAFAGWPALGFGPQGAGGFWLMAILATVLAAVLVGGMLRGVARKQEAEG